MERGVGIVECKAWNVECKVSRVDCRGCGVQSVECKVRRRVKCEVWSEKRGSGHCGV